MTICPVPNVNEAVRRLRRLMLRVAMDIGSVGSELFRVFEERIGKLPAMVLIYAAYSALLAFFLQTAFNIAVVPLYAFSMALVDGSLLKVIKGQTAAIAFRTFNAVVVTIFVLGAGITLIYLATRALANLWIKDRAFIRREVSAAWAATPSPWKRVWFCFLVAVNIAAIGGACIGGWFVIIDVSLHGFPK